MACINTDTKNELIQKIEHFNIPSSEAQILAEFVDELPICSILDTPKGKKGERKLTKYNLFLSECLKGTSRHTKQTMSQCIPDWRIIKECIKANGTFDGCKAQRGY